MRKEAPSNRRPTLLMTGGTILLGCLPLLGCIPVVDMGSTGQTGGAGAPSAGGPGGTATGGSGGSGAVGPATGGSGGSASGGGGSGGAGGAAVGGTGGSTGGTAGSNGGGSARPDAGGSARADGGARPDGGSGSTDAAPAAPTFTRIYDEILTPGCTAPNACHSVPRDQYFLFAAGMKDRSYMLLINETPRVGTIPGRLNTLLSYTTPQNGAPVRMPPQSGPNLGNPPTRKPPLTMEQIQLIRTWALSGARND